MNKVVTFLFIILTSLIILKPPEDPDFGWHYKYGEYIFNNHRILRDNIFSYTMSDYKWANSYWVSQLIFFTMYFYLGNIYTNFIFNFVLFSFLFFIIFKNTNLFSKIVLGLVLIFLTYMFGINIRPMYFSTIFLFLLIYILLYKPHKIWYLPILFALWANFHADFMLGLGIFGLFTLQKLYELYIEKKFTPRNILNVSLPGILSIFATLLNPYFFGLWETLFKELHSHPMQNQSISEFRPYKFLSPILEVILNYMIVGLSLVLFYFKRKTLPYFLLASFVLFFFLQASSVYFLRIFIIIVTFPLMETIEKIKPDLTINKNQKLLKVFAGMYKICAVVAIFLLAVNSVVQARDEKKWTYDAGYPKNAVQYIKLHRPDGNMLNSYNWGGYLIKNLPEYKTFIDGRMPSWKDSEYSIFADYQKINSNPKKNKDLINDYIEKYQITWLVQQKITKPNKKHEKYNNLTKYLIEEQSWKIVYEDLISVVAVMQN